MLYLQRYFEWVKSLPQWYFHLNNLGHKKFRKLKSKFDALLLMTLKISIRSPTYPKILTIFKSVTEMLVTSFVGDFMMVNDLRCWYNNHYISDFFRYVGDFLNVLNRSSTSWISHQHLKLVTNTSGPQHPSPISM